MKRVQAIANTRGLLRGLSHLLYVPAFTAWRISTIVWFRKITTLHVPSRTNRTRKSSHLVSFTPYKWQNTKLVWGLNLYNSSQ